MIKKIFIIFSIFSIYSCGEINKEINKHYLFSFKHRSGNVQKDEEEKITCNTNLKSSETSVELSNKIKAAASNSTVCLGSGTYPHVEIIGSEHESYVSIRPAPEATVTSGGFRLRNVSFLKFEKLIMTEGIEVEDTLSFAGSNNIQVLNNTFEEPHIGVYLRGGTGPVKKVLIEGNYIHKVRLNNEAECRAGKGDGQDVTMAFADGVTIKHNTFYQAAWHYIQGGGSLEGAIVENNLFEGKHSCVNAHLNIWQIFAGGENNTFNKNIVMGLEGETASSDLLEFENGVGSSECSVHMKNTVVENNLFVKGGDNSQIWTTEGLKVNHNTSVNMLGGFSNGISASSPHCGAGKNYEITHNISVEGSIFGGESTEGNVFDFNVSENTSANASGSTHFVTNWTPEWENTTWNPLGGGKIPAGFYIPKGLSFEAGYRGSIGP